ncbi:hypothetical protein CsatB_015557 [Cannabis sativa]
MGHFELIKLEPTHFISMSSLVSEGQFGNQTPFLTPSWAQTFKRLFCFDQVVVMAQLNKEINQFIFKGVPPWMSYPKCHFNGGINKMPWSPPVSFERPICWISCTMEKNFMEAKTKSV